MNGKRVLSLLLALISFNVKGQSLEQKAFDYILNYADSTELQWYFDNKGLFCINEYTTGEYGSMFWIAETIGNVNLSQVYYTEEMLKKMFADSVLKTFDNIAYIDSIDSCNQIKICDIVKIEFDNQLFEYCEDSLVLMNRFSTNIYAPIIYRGSPHVLIKFTDGSVFLNFVVKFNEEGNAIRYWYKRWM